MRNTIFDIGYDFDKFIYNVSYEWAGLVETIMIDDEVVERLYNFTIEDFVDIMNKESYHISQVMLDFLLILKGKDKIDDGDR